jgi:hypothetical protein
MLASTVQFSNNDQPPITPGLNRSALGPALKAANDRPYLQTPNSVPGTLATQIGFPRPEGQYLQPEMTESAE